jgi:hypothetical protein
MFTYYKLIYKKNIFLIDPYNKSNINYFIYLFILYLYYILFFFLQLYLKSITLNISKSYLYTSILNYY